jgi:hypothetical protein
MKSRTKRFYNNINAKTLKSLEELVTAIAIIHNIISTGGGNTGSEHLLLRHSRTGRGWLKRYLG